MTIRPPVLTRPPLTEFLREALSIAGLNAFARYISPGRLQMFATSHIAQKIVTFGMKENYIQTGIEQEFAKYTFGVRMPCDGKIFNILQRYPTLDSVDGIKSNPETVVVYENTKTKEHGCLTLPTYFSFHNYFGFEYKPGPGASQLYDTRDDHRIVPEGTTFLDSPGVTANGNYMYGVPVKTVFLSHPGIAEDGLVFRRKALDKFKFYRYEVRTGEWGASQFAINIDGTVENPRIFRDIGEQVRDDGLLMAFRSYDDFLSPVEMNINAVRQIDHAYDNKLYANGPGGTIVDIRVTTNMEASSAGSNLDVQLKKYIDAKRLFYTNILHSYQTAKRANPSLQVTRQYHALLIKAMVETNFANKNLNKVYKKVPIDHYRVEFVVRYEVTPSIGFKLTELCGGKGVICLILEDHQMPKDANGTIADVIMSPEARTNRMNIGGLYEHYFNACSYQIQRDLWAITGISKNDRSAELKLKTMLRNDPDRFNRAWERLIGYYRIVAPLQAYFYDTGEIPIEGVIGNMAKCITDFVYLYMPPDYAPDYMEILHECDAWCKPIYGPVTFESESGELITTKTKARIGHMYMMLLEKTADDWSAVASAKIQHYGFLAKISKSDKYGEPGRAQPIRAVGETEFRIILAYCGMLCMAEIMDRNNNPETHKQVIFSILGAENPTNIPYNIVRDEGEGNNVHPFGNTAMIQIFMHVMNVMGLGFEYISERDTDYEALAKEEQKYQVKMFARQ